MLENSYPIRTDLALESQERLQEDQADMRGIRVLEERRENGVIVSTVMIETENASVAMGRPKGTYITIEAPEMIEEEPDTTGIFLWSWQRSCGIFCREKRLKKI